MNTITKRVALDKAVKAHILESIDFSGYDVPLELIQKASCVNIPFNEYEEGKLSLLYTTFKSEYGWAVLRMGEQQAFKEWLQGLPTCIGIHWTNHDILKFALSTGYYGEKMTEKQEDAVLANWFNLVSVKTFQLFRKYKIA